MTSDLVDLLVLVNRLRSLMASHHHAPELTTTSCLTLPMDPVVPTEVHFCLCLHKKGTGQPQAVLPFLSPLNSQVPHWTVRSLMKAEQAALVTGTTPRLAQGLLGLQEVVFGEQRKGLQAFPQAVVTALSIMQSLIINCCVFSN